MDFEKVIGVRADKTVYKDGNTAVKVFNEDYSKANVLNEALNQAYVEETGINIPHVIEVKKIDGKWAIVSDYIKGKTLEQLMKENPGKTDEYMELFVNIQTDIHKKRCHGLRKIWDKMTDKMSEADIDPTNKYELQTRIAGMKKHHKVLHGDYTPSNVIITDDGTPYVIDWAHATQGNASADAARTYLTFYLAGEKDLAEKYLTLFSKKTDIAKQLVQRWLPIVAASQLVKGKEEEREFLLSWADIVEYE